MKIASFDLPEKTRHCLLVVAIDCVLLTAMTGCCHGQDVARISGGLIEDLAMESRLKGLKPEAAAVLAFRVPGEELELRYKRELVALAWSPQSLGASLSISAIPLAYYCKEEFLSWLLTEREDIRMELELSSEQLVELEFFERDLKRWRREFAEAMVSESSGKAGAEELYVEDEAGPSRRRELGGGKEPGKPGQVQLVQQLAASARKSLKQFLTPGQQLRLKQLDRQMLLARHGSDFLNSYRNPEAFDGADPIERQAAEFFARHPEVLAELFSELNSIVPGAAVGNSPWCIPDKFLSVPVAEAIKRQALEHHVRLNPLFEIQAIVDLDSRVKALRQHKSLEDLWRNNGMLTISPVGVARWALKPEGTDAAANLMGNLALNSEWASYLELTADQQLQAVQVLVDRRAAMKAEEGRVLPQIGWPVDRSDLKQELTGILLPFQWELIEQRAVWREVCMFGFVPCLIAGRLGNQLNLGKRQREELNTSAVEMKAKMENIQVEWHGRRIETVVSVLVRAGADGWVQQWLGAPPKHTVLWW